MRRWTTWQILGQSEVQRVVVAMVVEVEVGDSSEVVKVLVAKVV